LKLGYRTLVGLVVVSSFSLATVCLGQSTLPTDPSDLIQIQSAQPPANNPSPQPAPTDQPSAPNATQNQNTPTPADPQSTEDQKKKEMDRMFYVMPNYLTVDNQAQVPPVSWKEKFAMAAKGSFDPYEFVTVGIVAGIRQAENSSPGFGQGAEGYFKRYGASFADQVDGNIMVGGVFPTILKADPRYFRLGRGSKISRMGYAVSRIFVTRTDSGHSAFNVSEFAGNATAIAISLAYYPDSDRGFSSSLSSWGTQMGIDAFGNELKEFWPDIHHYLQRRHQRHLEREAQKKADN
jgi:hypothetical protein